jgi:hypothetical protein
MMNTIKLSFVAVSLALVGPVHATSFIPYSEQIVADSNGHYYVVVKRKDDSGDYGPISLTLAERKPGSSPVRSATAREATPRGTFLAKIDPAIRVRDGDIVHGRIDLNQPPKVILVSSTGKGIVTMDKYGFNGLGSEAGVDDLVVYSLKGKVLHRKNRDGVFPANARWMFHHGDGYVGWLRDSWLDDKRGEIVIVGQLPKDKAVLTVNFESGEVRTATTELIDRAITERDPNGLSQALDLAREFKVGGSKAAWFGILADEKLPLYTRLQSAVLMASVGDQRGEDLVKKAALDKPAKVNDDAQLFAVKSLPEVLGDKAAPVICDYVRRYGKEGTVTPWSAMHEISAQAAVPELRRLLDRKEPVHCQLFALECLGRKGPAAKAAVPDLIRILDGEPLIQDLGWTQSSTHDYAARALGRIGPEAKDALPVLVRHAEATAPKEWAKVKDEQPNPERDLGGGIQYSKNPFIDAICKIRKKPDKE